MMAEVTRAGNHTHQQLSETQQTFWRERHLFCSANC